VLVVLVPLIVLFDGSTKLGRFSSALSAGRGEGKKSSSSDCLPACTLSHRSSGS
jgi:hypothetical protein